MELKESTFLTSGILKKGESISCSVLSDFMWPHGVQFCQASLSVGFSRQEYWSGLPFLAPGDLPNPGTEPRSPALYAESFLSKPPEKTILQSYSHQDSTHQDSTILAQRQKSMQINGTNQKVQRYIHAPMDNLAMHLWTTQEKAMAPHSSTLAWKTPWMEEPGRLQSMGS